MYKALMWAATRGQLEGVFGAPPRNEGDGELVIKQAFLWMVADQASKELNIQRPFFAMETPLRSTLWDSPTWKEFLGKYGFPVLEVSDAQEETKYVVATNLDMYSSGKPLARVQTELGTSMAPFSWPTWMRQATLEGIQFWRQRPDDVQLARHLNKMESSLEAMSDKDLRRWAQHVRDGHVPYNKRCRTCVETAATQKAHGRVLAPSCYTLSLRIEGKQQVGKVSATCRFLCDA